ncbi:MAG: hypothetical protein AB6733_01740 [Clostridiaceae bacterium]
MQDNIRDLYAEASNYILAFKDSSSNFLNVISLPYNKTSIFKDLVLNTINSKKKILYITNEKKDSINFLKTIKKYGSIIRYSYFDMFSDNRELEAELVFTNHSNAIKIGRVFDLIIYDDLSSYSSYTKFEILGLLSRCVKDKNTKIISYSFTKVFNIENEIYIPAYKNALPLVEPRIMVTRVNTNKEIPNCAFEHLKYSIIMNRKVIIYIPEQEVLMNTYEYLENISTELTKNIHVFSNGKDEEKLIKRFKSEKRIIVLTSEFEERLYCESGEVEYLIFFNENLYHKKKKLLFICGRISDVDMDKRGEVVFLTNDIDSDIDIIKSITRRFNESAWKMGLLKI